jgi:quercetin dioxygenase-like cupin family protein
MNRRSGIMREIRTFELDGREAPARWVIDRPQTLRVTRGRIWLTIEGDTDDHWLDAGDSVELEPYTTIWVSASREASWFSLASTSGRTHTRGPGDLLRAWLGRRPQPAKLAALKA